MRKVTIAAGALLLLIAVLAGSGPSAAAPGLPSARGESSCSHTATHGSNPLEGICAYLDGREGIVQVAVYNRKNRHTYLLSNGDHPQVTASIVKVDILAMWLHHLQQRGVEIPDGIDYSIRYLMHRMIENSDNAAATALFHFGGGCHSLTHFNTLIPLHHTDVGCESPTYYGWGNTTTTAADQVALMKVFAYGKPHHVLGHDARTFGRTLMESVEPDQRFGLTCGPWGTTCDPPNYAPPDPDVTVALKNGWKTLPTCTLPIDQCPWQVNSTGWVHGRGRNYLLTVLTTEDPVGSGGLYGFNYGIETAQGVSRRVWENLGN